MTDVCQTSYSLSDKLYVLGWAWFGGIVDGGSYFGDY